ncbi:D-cysteine desulfhydrase family protein [Fusibacter ferrireducens]|uniref:D-cysteine desulfhydrase family protein n=1 Tax=Fusibacter ferrireducens TaxID=2785058 RepID=A0ABS0A0E9_9FIRM|nr:D-cysteine desulfhydrase family protein [Fusibacter ferrireducens]MBF4695716.1 D-cysteine desulfhydrase family protein [Fusibacter ferrireducens]
MKIPSRLSIANMPTPIQKLSHISQLLHKNVYIKRDDYTGNEWSGNKIRKLEYALNEAIQQGATTVITCGGLQSNHARATTAVANHLGLKTHLVLRGAKQEHPQGNLLLNEIMGAQISYLEPEIFNRDYLNYMEQLKTDYAQKGIQAYIIPIGASNGIGNFGYYNCFQEIKAQEEDLSIQFDTIVTTVGSGGTYGGLFLGNLLENYPKKIVGFNISSTPDYFKSEITEIVKASLAIMNCEATFNTEDIQIIGGYEGIGYALTQPFELEFIKKIASLEGLILDPVYTGKAFRGLYNEIEKGTFDNSQNILFIHTGGLSGLHSFSAQFNF